MATIRVLDLFSGAGGSSYGARSAGAHIVGGVDAWDVASRTFASNFPTARALNYVLSGNAIHPDVLALGDIDLLLASPECTNHTCARGARPRSEESRMTAWQVIHHAQHLKPRWVVVENVVQMRAWDRFDDFLSAMVDLGYAPESFVLNAADFGVPQSRRRLFLVFSQDQKAFELLDLPKVRVATVRDILDESGVWKVRPLRTKGRAEATLERAERAIATLGPNEAFLLVYYGSDYAGGWQDLERPLRTLTTVDRFALVEPSPNGHTIRMLQTPELLRAMGYGKDFKLEHGTRRDRVKLMGNGVCPPVMKHIVSTLRACQSRTKRRQTPGTVVSERRRSWLAAG